MNQRIIYPNDNGGVAVIIPADCGLTIDQIAAKDVPPIIRYVGTGVFETDDNTGESFEVISQVVEPRPFLIVDASDIPTDRSQRDAWTADFSNAEVSP